MKISNTSCEMYSMYLTMDFGHGGRGGGVAPIIINHASCNWVFDYRRSIALRP